jgi:tRNA A-37 threonylcarbamoyl transferase component Bud32
VEVPRDRADGPGARIASEVGQVTPGDLQRIDAPIAARCHDVALAHERLRGPRLAPKTIMPTSRAMPKPFEAVVARRPVLLADRFRIERALEDGRFEAADTSRGAGVVVTRVPFGRERAEERARLIERVRALWTVTAPALVLPIDAGVWDDDAYVVEEKVEAPFTSIAAGLSRLDAYERASAARNLAEGVATLHAAGFVHGNLSLETILLDGYRQPKIHTATIAMPATAETERVEDRTLRTLLDEIAPGATKTAAVDATAAELARAIPHVDPGAPVPFVPVVDTPNGWRGLTVLAIFLTLAAFIAAGWLFGQH